MKLRTSPYKTPSKAARLALALAAARAIVILQELKREQPLVLIKLPRLDEIARGLLRALQGFEIVEAVACPERWPLTAAQRLLEDATAVSPRRCKQSRIAHATLPARATAPVERSEALG